MDWWRWEKYNGQSIEQIYDATDHLDRGSLFFLYKYLFKYLWFAGFFLLVYHF